MNPIRVIKINAHTRLTSCILGNCACLLMVYLRSISFIALWHLIVTDDFINKTVGSVKELLESKYIVKFAH